MISFDLDGTLLSYDGKPIHRVIDIAKGKDAMVITRREPDEDALDFIKEHLGDIPVVFTNKDWKWHTIQKYGVTDHYDDDPREIELIHDNTDVKTNFVDDDKSEKRKERLKESRDEKSILIIDDGLYLSFAERLTREFSTVYYWSEWRDKIFTTSVKEMVGTGIPGVVRAEHWSKYIDDVEVVFFPSCMYSFEQALLESLGYQCFGSGSSHELENDRLFMKKWVEDNKLNQVSYNVLHGIDNLLDYLEEEEGDKWVKISKNRGDGETYHHWNIDASRQHFNQMKMNVGFKAETYEFIVEDELRGVEYGVDTYCVNGKMPQNVMVGYEMKDQAYIGVMSEQDELPKEMQVINGKLCEYMAKCNCNTFVSNEIRVTDDKKNYLTDPTQRCPVPPNESYQVNLTNLGEIITEGSKWHLVEPKYKKKYVAQVIIRANGAKDNWTPIVYPEKYKDNIRLYFYANKDGITYIAPLGEDDIVCSVVGLGDTVDKAIEECLMIAEQVKCDDIEYNPNIFNEALDVIKAGEKVGIRVF